MSNKKEIIVDKFLESHNMDYLFCILAEKEADRLSILPESVKKSFKEKSTTMALKHIAMNDVPDFIVEEHDSVDEQNLDNVEYEEEYEDDRKSKLSKELDVFDSLGQDIVENLDDDE